jgi:ribosomal protein S8E
LHDITEVRRMEEKRRESGRKREQNKRKKIDCECKCPIIITIIAPPHLDIYTPWIRVLGTVGIGALPIPAQLGYLPSAGTSLLEYKRDVPVARPHGGQEKRKKREDQVIKSDKNCDR